MTYEPNIIVQFAERLYKQANAIIFRTTTLALLLGASLGGFFGFMAGGAHDGPTLGLIGACLVGILASAFGFLIGRERAFALKLQAQTSLCQLQIEINTRSPAASVGQYPMPAHAANYPASATR